MLDILLEYWVEILFGLFTTLFTYFFKVLASYKKSIDNTTTGVIIMLKSKIIEDYNRLIDQEEISISEIQDIFEMYEVYRRFQCCDVIENLIEKLDSIPIK